MGTIGAMAAAGHARMLLLRLSSRYATSYAAATSATAGDVGLRGKDNRGISEDKETFQADGVCLKYVQYPLLRTKVSRGHLFSSAADDTHNDFKPITHGEPADVKTTIEKDVSENKVFVYMKGVPEAPQCGFSMTVCRILDFYGAKYGSRNVLADQDIREGIKNYTSWPTIPQVFIDGEFVGGCDIMISMHEEGELASALGVKDPHQ